MSETVGEEKLRLLEEIAELSADLVLYSRSAATHIHFSAYGLDKDKVLKEEIFRRCHRLDLLNTRAT